MMISDNKFIFFAMVSVILILVGIVFITDMQEISFDTAQVVIMIGFVLNTLVTIVGWRQTYLIQKRDRVDKFKFERKINRIREIEKHIDDLSHAISILTSLGLVMQHNYSNIKFKDAIFSDTDISIIEQLTNEFTQVTDKIYPDMGKVSDLVNLHCSERLREIFFDITDIVTEISKNMRDHTGQEITNKMEGLLLIRREMRTLIDEMIDEL